MSESYIVNFAKKGRGKIDRGHKGTSPNIPPYVTAPYSGVISDFVYGMFVETGPPKGWGLLSSGLLIAYDAIKNFVSNPEVTPCGGR